MSTICLYLHSVLSWRCYCLSLVQLLTCTMIVSTLLIPVLSPLTRSEPVIVYVNQFPFLWEPGWLAQLDSLSLLSFFLFFLPVGGSVEFCDWLCHQFPVLWEPCWKAQNIKFNIMFYFSYLSAYYIDHQSSQVLGYSGVFSILLLSYFADYWFS